MAARRERGLFDPEAAPGEPRSTTTSTCICSDGDIEEGISHEVSALAGHQQLGNLMRDLRRQRDLDRGRHPDRQDEDVAARYEAYGWHVQTVDWRARRRRRGRLPRGRRGAVRGARWRPRPRPTGPRSSRCAPSSAGPRPNKQNTGKIHGSALGADEVAATKQILGFDPAPVVRGRRGGARARPRGDASGAGAAHAEWQPGVRRLGGGQPRAARRCTTGWPPGRCRRAGPTRCRSSPPTPRASPPGPRPARSWRRSRRCCRSCGAARPTWRRATTPR